MDYRCRVSLINNYHVDVDRLLMSMNVHVAAVKDDIEGVDGNPYNFKIVSIGRNLNMYMESPELISVLCMSLQQRTDVQPQKKFKCGCEPSQRFDPEHYEKLVSSLGSKLAKVTEQFDAAQGLPDPNTWKNIMTMIDEAYDSYWRLKLDVVGPTCPKEFPFIYSSEDDLDADESS